MSKKLNPISPSRALGTRVFRVAGLQFVRMALRKIGTRNPDLGKAFAFLSRKP